MNARSPRKAAFIDRDGVINVESAYVHRIDDFTFLPGAVDALRRLQEAGYLLVVVTNQSGIARGMYSEADYLELENHLRTSLTNAGVILDAVEYCPHLPDASVERYRLACDCRKPQPGMLLSAATSLGIDMACSIVIGDRGSDIEAGRRAGVGRCCLVRSGQRLVPADIALADAVYDDLANFVAGEIAPER